MPASVAIFPIAPKLSVASAMRLGVFCKTSFVPHRMDHPDIAMSQQVRLEALQDLGGGLLGDSSVMPWRRPVLHDRSTHKHRCTIEHNPKRSRRDNRLID